MSNVVSLARDSFNNLLSGLGVFGRDKAVHQQWVLSLLTPAELESAYRGDWMCRKIVQIPANDAVREWRSWEASQKQVKVIEETERSFEYQLKLYTALERARLYGGSAIVMGIDQGTFEEELDIDKVGKGDLKFMHVVSRWYLSAGPLVRDITSPWFGEPSYYMRSNIATPDPPGNVESVGRPIEGYSSGEVLYIHPSRVVRLIGHEYPDMENAPDAWGDSVIQPVADALKDVGLITSSVAAMVSEAKLDVIQVPGLLNMLSTKIGSEQLTERFSKANAAKSVINALLIDKDEIWNRKELGLSNVDKVLQMYLFICSGAADIPTTRLLGREPSGHNATGDSDTRNYYDRLAAEQELKYKPALSRLDEVLIRHALGERDPDISYKWNPLWQMSGPEQAGVVLQHAQAFKIDAESGLINSEALARGRVAQLVEDRVYPGMSTEGDEALDLELLAKERDEAINPPQPMGPVTSGVEQPPDVRAI